MMLTISAGYIDRQISSLVIGWRLKVQQLICNQNWSNLRALYLSDSCGANQLKVTDGQSVLDPSLLEPNARGTKPWCWYSLLALVFQSQTWLAWNLAWRLKVMREILYTIESSTRLSGFSCLLNNWGTPLRGYSLQCSDDFFTLNPSFTLPRSMVHKLSSDLVFDDHERQGHWCYLIVANQQASFFLEVDEIASGQDWTPIMNVVPLSCWALDCIASAQTFIRSVRFLDGSQSPVILILGGSTD